MCFSRNYKFYKASITRALRKRSRNLPKDELNSVLFRKRYFGDCCLNVDILVLERESSRVNSNPGFAYPFEKRPNLGLRQHSGVSTRFRRG